MLYISGALFWVAAWACINPTLPGKYAIGAGISSWIGLVMWELAMRENRNPTDPGKKERAGMIQFRAERGWSFDGYQAWVIEYRNDRSYVAKPMELIFEELPEMHSMPEPTIKIQGPLVMELIPQLRKALAGFDHWSKEDYDQAKRVETAMQAHIDSLRMVVQRTIPPQRTEET